MILFFSFLKKLVIAAVRGSFSGIMTVVGVNALQKAD